jgi:hypothetical protein
LAAAWLVTTAGACRESQEMIHELAPKTMSSVGSEYFRTPCPADAGVKEQAVLRGFGRALALGKASLVLQTGRYGEEKVFDIQLVGATATVGAGNLRAPFDAGALRALVPIFENATLKTAKLGWDTPNTERVKIDVDGSSAQLEWMSKDTWLVTVKSCEAMVTLPGLLNVYRAASKATPSKAVLAASHGPDAPLPSSDAAAATEKPGGDADPTAPSQPAATPKSSKYGCGLAAAPGQKPWFLWAIAGLLALRSRTRRGRPLLMTA